MESRETNPVESGFDPPEGPTPPALKTEPVSSPTIDEIKSRCCICLHNFEPDKLSAYSCECSRISLCSGCALQWFAESDRCIQCRSKVSEFLANMEMHYVAAKCADIIDEEKQLSMEDIEHLVAEVEGAAVNRLKDSHDELTYCLLVNILGRVKTFKDLSASPIDDMKLVLKDVYLLNNAVSALECGNYTLALDSIESIVVLFDSGLSDDELDELLGDDGDSYGGDMETETDFDTDTDTDLEGYDGDEYYIQGIF